MKGVAQTAALLVALLLMMSSVMAMRSTRRFDARPEAVDRRGLRRHVPINHAQILASSRARRSGFVDPVVLTSSMAGRRDAASLPNDAPMNEEKGYPTFSFIRPRSGKAQLQTVSDGGLRHTMHSL